MNMTDSAAVRLAESRRRARMTRLLSAAARVARGLPALPHTVMLDEAPEPVATLLVVGDPLLIAKHLARDPEVDGTWLKWALPSGVCIRMTHP